MKRPECSFVKQRKIAHSLIPYEQFLAASFYGKFFARNLHLHLLKQRPKEWEDLQSNSKTANAPKPGQPNTQPPSQPQPSSSATPVTSDDKSSKKSSKKRNLRDDEIDAVFDAALGKKTKKAAVALVPAQAVKDTTDQQMEDVFSAIRVAPGGESGPVKKKRRKD